MSERDIFKTISDKVNSMNLDSGLQVSQILAQSPWRRCEELIRHMTPEQLSWSMSQPKVKEAEGKMKEAFDAYLFEKMREEFALFGGGCYVPYINEYIDSLGNVSQGYVSRTEQLEKEAERAQVLEKQLAELQAKVEQLQKGKKI